MSTNLSTLQDPRLNVFFNSLPQASPVSTTESTPNTGSNQNSHNHPSGNGRKRPRTRAPTAQQAFLYGVPNASTLSSKLTSSDPDDVARALNTLLKLTSDHELNYALGEGGEKVLDALVFLFDEAIGWRGGNPTSNRTNDNDNIGSTEDYSNRCKNDEEAADATPSFATWRTETAITGPYSQRLDGTSDGVDWSTFCKLKFIPHFPNTFAVPTHILPANILTSEPALRRIEAIIMVLRNLTYVQANIRFMLHSSPGILRILVGSLRYRNFIAGKTERNYTKANPDDALSSNVSGSAGVFDPAMGNGSNNICLHAVNALTNLVPSLDPTGRRLFADLMLLDDTRRHRTDDTVHTTTTTITTTNNNNNTNTIDIASHVPPNRYGKIHSLGLFGMSLAKKFKNETFSRVPPSIYQPLVGNHIRSVSSIFPPLVDLLSVTAGCNTSRSVLIASMELWKELVEIEENTVLLSYIPDLVLVRLVHLLWLPRLGPDSLEYISPATNSVNRVGALKLTGGYDHTVDYEVRDRALELLGKLVAVVGPDLAKRLGRRMTVRRPVDRYGVDEVVVDGVLPLSLVEEQHNVQKDNPSSNDDGTDRPNDSDDDDDGGGNDNSDDDDSDDDDDDDDDGSSKSAPNPIKRIPPASIPNTRFYDAILPALTTMVGRDHTPQLAAKLLVDVAAVPENRVGIAYIRTKVMRVVSRSDTYVAHLLTKAILSVDAHGVD